LQVRGRPAGEHLAVEPVEQRRGAALPAARLPLVGDERDKLERRALTVGVSRKVFHGMAPGIFLNIMLRVAQV
jgi:hypothetical protein